MAEEESLLTKIFRQYGVYAKDEDAENGKKQS